MTKRTTESWEALLDGTTPGPWVWIDEPDDADTQYIVDWATGGMCLSLDAIGSGSAYKPSDPVLAAAAPEAVTELVRLRREVATLRDQMTKTAEKYKAFYDRDRDHERLLAAEYDRQTADILTHILEGGSNDQ